ncbi:MAG: choice-of-anchor D domain-containing protein [Myxococcales bacterium]|nr:choice-of-anchor D domain-containing protein [Myxococcales bacterium]
MLRRHAARTGYTRRVRSLILLSIGAMVAGCHPLGSFPNAETGAGLPDVTIDVSPLDLEFGDVDAGETVDAVVTLRNLGSESVTLGAPPAPVGDEDYTVLALEDHSIAPGGSVSLTVRFSPASNSPATAQLVIAEAASVVTMSGTGRAPQMATGDAELNAVVLGCTGVGTIPVWNAGSRDLEIADVRSTAEVFEITSWPASLAPGDTGAVQFSFTPVVGGLVEASFVFEANDPVATAKSVAVSSLGYEGEEVSERFEFLPTDPTDILFVVDGSSIAPFASRAAGAAEAYVAALEEASVDFQMTAVSSSSECPASPTYATRADTSARASTVLSRAFSEAGGPWDADLLGLAGAALGEASSLGCLDGFRRAGADLEVVVVALGPSGAPLGDELVQLQAAAGADVRVSALVPTDGSCGTRADDYLAVVDATAGVAEDVCELDWVDGFQSLARLPGGAGDVRFALAEVPVSSTLVVSVGGVPMDGWLWEATTNELVFVSSAFPLGTDLDIRYVAAVACAG